MKSYTCLFVITGNQCLWLSAPSSHPVISKYRANLLARAEEYQFTLTMRFETEEEEEEDG